MLTTEISTTIIGLTDNQMGALLSAARPLPPDRRSEFLEHCARELAALPEVGDGVLHRTIALIQRQYWDPPQFGRTAGWHKYK
jgi:hypothetical protein